MAPDWQKIKVNKMTENGRSMIDKRDLAKTIVSHMSVYEKREAGLFLDWVNRESTSMEDVLKWATAEEIEETQRDSNELTKLS